MTFQRSLAALLSSTLLLFQTPLHAQDFPPPPVVPTLEQPAPAPAPISTPAPAPVSAETPAPAPASAEKPAKPEKARKPKLNAWPAMWQVKDKDTTIYLMGTVHVLNSETVWFGGQVRKRFDQADTLVLELVQPPAEQMAKKIQAMAVATDGIALTARMTEKQKAAYITQMEGAGLRWQGFEITKPWMPAMALSLGPITKAGYSAEAGVEGTLTAAAEAVKKPIVGLETAEQQLGYFDGMPMESQVAFLNATVEEVPKAQEEFVKLMDAWSRGKPDALADLMNDSLEKTPEIAKVLISERNGRWADWIKARLESTPGVVFVAVGAGHLAGNDSVQVMLERQGVKAKRISTR